MIRRIKLAAASVLVAGLGALGLALAPAASAAPAGLSGQTLVTSDEAGYLASPNIGDPSFAGIQGTFFLRAAAQQIGDTGLPPGSAGQVISLCSSKTPTTNGLPTCPTPNTTEINVDTSGAIGLVACNNAVTADGIELGVVLNNDGTFDVVWGTGTMARDGNGNCADVLLSTGSVTVLRAGIPQGHTLTLRIARNHAFAHVKVQVADLSTASPVASADPAWHHNLDQAGAGVLVDPHLMTNSLDNTLVVFRDMFLFNTHVTATTGTAGFTGSRFWTGAKVIAKNSGVTFLAPAPALGTHGGRVFGVAGGQPVV
jgi:hypothetical protein